MPYEEPGNRISSAVWERIAADMERLALTNDDLKRGIEELRRRYTEALDENDRLRKLLLDHDIPFTGRSQVS